MAYYKHQNIVGTLLIEESSSELNFIQCINGVVAYMPQDHELTKQFRAGNIPAEKSTKKEFYELKKIASK